MIPDGHTVFDYIIDPTKAGTWMRWVDQITLEQKGLIQSTPGLPNSSGEFFYNKNVFYGFSILCIVLEHFWRTVKSQIKAAACIFFSRFLVRLIYESGLYWADFKII